MVTWCYIGLLTIGLHHPFADTSLVTCATQRGREFVLGFLENVDDKGEVKLLITTDATTPATVNITLPLARPLWRHLVTVDKGTVAEVVLPPDIRGRDTEIGEKGVWVQSSQEISVTGVNSATFSTGAYLALPTDLLDREYYAATYQGSPQLLVVATENDTKLMVKFVDNTTAAEVFSKLAANGQYEPGRPIEVHLNRFSTLHVARYRKDADFTGTYINASHPVAVFSGNRQASSSKNVGISDHVTEMMIPVQRWGRTYMTVSTPNTSRSDLYRVLASQDNTSVCLSGGTTFSLSQAGDFVQREVPANHHVVLNADKPVSLVMLSTTPGHTQCCDGDAALTVLPAATQYDNSYTWRTVQTAEKLEYNNYMSVAIHRNHTAGLRLDGRAVVWNLSESTPPSGSIAQMWTRVIPGVHTVSHLESNVTFLALVTATSQWNAYSYPLGMRFCDADSSAEEEIRACNDFTDETKRQGEITRPCLESGAWGNVTDTSECFNDSLQNTANNLQVLSLGKYNRTLGQLLQELANATSGSLSQADVRLAVTIVTDIAYIFRSGGEPLLTAEHLKNFVHIADNLLHASSQSWHEQMHLAFRLVHVMDNMGETFCRQLNVTEDASLVFSAKKIVLEAGQSLKKDISFPDSSRQESYPSWIKRNAASAYLPADAVADGAAVRYTAIAYRNLTNILSVPLSTSMTPEGLTNTSVNSAVLTLTVASHNASLRRPVTLAFSMAPTDFESLGTPTCRFLDFDPSGSALWSEAGCRVLTSSNWTVQCSCDHLTSFAVLISPYRPITQDAQALTYLTYIGCGLSVFFLIVTITAYVALWRHVKSDRSKLLLNLFVVHLIAYVIFLAGVDRTEDQLACKLVAVVLHYVLLVLFMTMLCEGLEIFIAVFLVFPVRSIIRWLLVAAYGVPAIVVGVSVAVRLDGYGGYDFCWLSGKDGLLWAFVGPALAVILVNLVIMAGVISRVLNSTSFVAKETKLRAWSVVKSVCVMTPVLGLTWLVGVLSVSDDTVVFQYLFLVFNSLQGLLIFIFHCALAKEVRQGARLLLQKHRTRRSMRTASVSRYTSHKSVTIKTSTSASDNSQEKGFSDSVISAPTGRNPKDRHVTLHTVNTEEVNHAWCQETDCQLQMPRYRVTADVKTKASLWDATTGNNRIFTTEEQCLKQLQLIYPGMAERHDGRGIIFLPVSSRRYFQPPPPALASRHPLSESRKRLYSAHRTPSRQPVVLRHALLSPAASVTDERNSDAALQHGLYDGAHLWGPQVTSCDAYPWGHSAQSHTTSYDAHPFSSLYL